MTDKAMKTLEFTTGNKRTSLLVALALLMAGAAARDARAQTSNQTEIAYQGFLTVDGQPANGFYDFRIRLLDNSLRQVGPQADPPGLAVSNGFFQVELYPAPGAGGVVLDTRVLRLEPNYNGAVSLIGGAGLITLVRP